MCTLYPSTVSCALEHQPVKKGARGASPEVTEEHVLSRQSESSLPLCSCTWCSECGKRWCICANERLIAAEERTLQHIKAETWTFSVWKLSLGGTTHHPSGHLCIWNWTTYYSAPCCLPPVCCHCGVEDNLLHNFSEYVVEMREKFSVVWSVCHGWRHAGRCQKPRGQKFFQKKKDPENPPSSG